MDFFQSQDQARKKTKFLVIYFALAVAAIIFSVYLVVFPLLYFQNSREVRKQETEKYMADQQRAPYQEPRDLVEKRSGFFQLDWFVVVGVCVVGVVVFGSGSKMGQLAGGGSKVALELGGRRIDPDTGDANERKLMNVVEEMAIASGMPVPEVYLLEHEDGINAFAAGKSVSDAAIGVTRGAIQYLTRDELQGVVASQFSHILNGDMRMNLRLIGILHGILVLAIIGRIMLRGAAHVGGDSKEGAAGAAGLGLMGIGLLIVGYVGVLFGRLIKSAISRQRVFLADASSVQFTRNPEGTGGALKKIGGSEYGSRLTSARAEEISHMVFANAMSPRLMRGLSTHPPLDARIRKIDKGWDGKFIDPPLAEISSSMPETKQASGGVTGAPSLIPGMEGHGGIVAGMAVAAALEGIGQVRPEQVQRAREIRSELPPQWLEAAHNTGGAQALIFSMLLAQDDDLRAGELRMLRDATDELTFQMASGWHAEISELGSTQKIALIDLALPALKRLSPSEYERFVEVMRELIASDGRVDLFEFMLERIVHRHLDLFFVRRPTPRVRYKTLGALEHEAAVLVSTMAGVSSSDPEIVRSSYAEGVRELELEIGGKVPMLPADACGLEQIALALEKFDEASPLVKRTLIYACAKAVMADGVIAGEEAELLRSVADTIGCPIPPFVREQTLAVSTA